MRILMVSDVYFPRINGVSTSIQTFRETLTQQGHEVVLIVPEYTTTTNDETDIHRIASRSIPFDQEDRLMKKGLVEEKIKALHKEHDFDLIHIQTPFVAHYAANKVAKQLGIPCVETYHTYFEEYMHNYIPLMPKWILKGGVRLFTRRQCNSVDALVVPSSAMKQVLEDYNVSSPMQIVPTGINVKLFDRGDGNSFRLKHNISAEQPVAVHIGRIGYEKNIDFLFHVHKQVVTKCPNAVFIVAGEGPALNHLRILANRLDLSENVRFVGYLDRETELLDCYRAGNVFVFSSRTETQGLVLLEALALGVPVVSTAVLGTRDILWKEKGALIAPEDVGQFADKVLSIMQDRQLQARLSDEGKAYAAEWSHEKITERMIDFYQGVLEQASTVTQPLTAESN